MNYLWRSAALKVLGLIRKALLLALRLQNGLTKTTSAKPNTILQMDPKYLVTPPGAWIIVNDPNNEHVKRQIRIYLKKKKRKQAKK